MKSKAIAKEDTHNAEHISLKICIILSKYNETQYSSIDPTQAII